MKQTTRKLSFQVLSLIALCLSFASVSTEAFQKNKPQRLPPGEVSTYTQWKEDYLLKQTGNIDRPHYYVFLNTQRRGKIVEVKYAIGGNASSLEITARPVTMDFAQGEGGPIRESGVTANVTEASYQTNTLRQRSVFTEANVEANGVAVTVEFKGQSKLNRKNTYYVQLDETWHGMLVTTADFNDEVSSNTPNAFIKPFAKTTAKAKAACSWYKVRCYSGVELTCCRVYCAPNSASGICPGCTITTGSCSESSCQGPKPECDIIQ